MTACIVGWAHTPFGKLAGETVESLIVRVAGEALADAGIAAKDVDEIVLGHFNAGFSAQDFTASLVLQASPDLRFKRATRVENACATGSAAVHQGLKSIAARRRAHRAGGRRRADDDDARPGDRPQSAQSLLCARGGRYRRRLRRHFRPDRRPLFPALGRSVGCARAHRRQEPQERRRQSLCADQKGSRLRLLPRRERKESAGRRPAQAHRLLAGVRRRGGAGAGRRRDRAEAQQGDRVPRRAACAGFSADVAARHSQIRRLGGGLAARVGAGRHRAERSVLRRGARLLHHRRTDRVRGDGACAGRAGRARHRRRYRRQGRQAADQSVRRAQSQRPSDRRHRRVDARHHRDAAHRHRRRHADQGCQARRHLQYGRRRGRQLRQHSGAAAVTLALRGYASGARTARCTSSAKKPPRLHQFVERAGLDDPAVLNTRMRVALRMVASRCAMTKVVRPLITSSSACVTLASVTGSSALVASSRIRIGGFFSKRAGDGEPLAFAAGQKPAALADRALQVLRDCAR